MPKRLDLAPLTWNEHLERAAADHQQDMTATGSMSGAGSDGTTYKDRIERYCRWGGAIFQAIDFGERREPVEVVVAWLVDDGNPKRTSRTNLLSKVHKHFAASLGTHPEADNCCVGIYSAQVVAL